MVASTSIYSLDLCTLTGVGEKRAGLLRRLGVDSVGALLRFYPRTYIDWSDTVSIAAAPYDAVCCISARAVERPKKTFIRKGMTLYKFLVTDDTSDMVVTLFNNPFAAQLIEPDRTYLFRGKVTGGFSRREMSAPEILPFEKADQRLRPVYRQTEGLPSRLIAAFVKQTLGRHLDAVTETLPSELCDSMDLCTLPFALQNIHFPLSVEALTDARRRLVFEELLVLQLGLFLMKSRAKSTTAPILSGNYTQDFYAFLPFSPTGAQRRVIDTCIEDMAAPRPMNRLVQGDVGSGKTVVAAALCHHAFCGGMQSAVMAPTEILAEQHYKFFCKTFASSSMTIALLTGSTPKKEKERIRARLLSGELSLVIGTHALLTEDVVFHSLGLIVTDEQHRFGVAQRAQLVEKGLHSHVLVMSATPIPRTLALIIYGDLDVSVLDELPPGRQPCETLVIGSDKRTRALTFVRNAIDEGRQAFIVCPLVEEGESDMAAATQYAEELRRGAFHDVSVGLLHGRLKASEKEAVMGEFSRGEISILVSTTVVEVGVDVPNAVIMFIENAERFGLSQLHQLRGRVGRGEHKSFCILLSDAQNTEARTRFEVMRSTTDGFKISDEDLKLRGPGDFFGARQHGLPSLTIADIATDLVTLTDAQHTAQRLLSADPLLESVAYAPLREQVEVLFDGQEIL